MRQFRRFALDVGFTFAALASTTVLGFVVSVLLGRYLGANALGLYKTVSVIYGILLLLSAFGIPAAVTKFTSERRDNRTRISLVASSGVISSAAIGCGIALLFYAISDMLESVFKIDGLADSVRILAPVFPFALVGGVLLGLLNGIREMKEFAAATILQSVLMVFLATCMILGGEGVRGVIASILLSSIGSCIYLLFVCQRHFSLTRRDFRETTKEVISFGGRVVGANAVNLVNYQGDFLLVGFLLTATDVGLYSAATGLALFFWIIPQAMQTITFPAITERWSNMDRDSVKKMVDKSTKFAALALVPIGLTVGFFGDVIMNLMFGPGFEGAVLPLQVLLVGTVMNGIMQRPIGSILFCLNLPELNLKIFSVAAAVNVVLNLVLIPSVGIVGASLARSVSFILVTLLILMSVRKVVGSGIDTQWFVRLCTATVICILLYVLLTHIGCQVAGIGLTIGLTVVIWFKFMQREDRDRVCDLVKDIACRLLGVQR